MAIRIRIVDGITVALCAAETAPLAGDVYLDDAQHYALAAKFRRDWHGQANTVEYPEEWAAMDTQFVPALRAEADAWHESPR